jgi:DNA-binding CsgD family transcriptional regulator
MGFAPHSLSPAELAALLSAERRAEPFLAFRDGSGDLRLEPLRGRERMTLGRLEHNDLPLGWDAEVSRTHAQLEAIGGSWTIVDDGLSRNGTFVNGERVAGRRRLQDGDAMRIGRTAVVFREPARISATTAIADPAARVRLTGAERRVLVALCRPLLSAAGSAIPAGNQEIADELSLSLPGVKTQIRSLFAKLDIGDHPQYRKRHELARRAVEAGLATVADL